MNSSKEVYIRTILGQKVDIRDYQKLYEEGAYDDQIPEQTGGMFLEFYWHDLKSGYNFYDEPWQRLLSNEGIRAKQDTDRNWQDFSHSLDHKGWLIKYYPPKFDTQGAPRNGRKRIRHFISNKERWVPAARWTYDPPKELESDDLNYENNRIDTGLQANAPTDNSEPTGFDEYKEGARYKIVLYANEGKKFNTPANIDKWFKEQGVFNLFHEDTVKKLRTAIMNISQDGNDFMYMMKQQNAESWLSKCDVLVSRNIPKLSQQPKDSKEKIVLYSPLEVNLYRILCKHILPNAAKGIKTLIILYTLGTDPHENVKEVKSFDGKIDNLINQAVSLIQHDLNGIKIDVPFITSMKKMLGAIPQRRHGKEGEVHEELFNRHELISIENY